jgi:hypothetical protein
MLLDAEDATEVPEAFVAVTVNVYAVFDCRPVTDIGDEAPVPVKLPGVEVTVYPVIPLVLPVVGAVNVTSARPLLNSLPAGTLLAVPIVGAFGAM